MRSFFLYQKMVNVCEHTVKKPLCLLWVHNHLPFSDWNVSSFSVCSLMCLSFWRPLHFFGKIHPLLFQFLYYLILVVMEGDGIKHRKNQVHRRRIRFFYWQIKILFTRKQNILQQGIHVIIQSKHFCVLEFCLRIWKLKYI